MRVLHVVTLVDDESSYGGPVRVALNQVAELRRRGHDVTLLAGWRGTGPPPAAVDGVALDLRPARSLAPGGRFAGLVSPGLLGRLARTVRGFDVVHVHAARDLVALPALAAARLARVPYVTQTHGMVVADERRGIRLLDALAVRRLVGGACAHLVLTDHEGADLAAVVGGSARQRVLPNGVVVAPLPSPPTGTPEVLFCARLHPRKRPEAFAAMAAELARRGTDATYALVGPDDGALAPALAAAPPGLVAYEGALPYDAVAGRVARASVYVLPSVLETFPMGLLEAMALGVPTVSTTSCGLAGPIADADAGIVTDGSPAALADAVQLLLDDPDRAATVRDNGRRLVEERFSIGSVVDRLEEVYAGCRPASRTRRYGARHG